MGFPLKGPESEDKQLIFDATEKGDPMKECKERVTVIELGYKIYLCHGTECAGVGQGCIC